MKMSLKAIRIDRGLSQKQLADELKINKKTLGSWENGKTCPPNDKVEALCKVLNVGYNDVRWRV